MQLLLQGRIDDAAGSCLLGSAIEHAVGRLLSNCRTNWRLCIRLETTESHATALKSQCVLNFQLACETDSYGKAKVMIGFRYTTFLSKR